MSHRRESMNHAIGQLQRITKTAVSTLEAIMEAEEEPAGARVSAARVVLELALRGLETLDFEKRISNLEAGLPHPNKNGRRC